VASLVLDEADRMLDLGFLEDVEKILAMLPGERQTMLFSATMPDPIVALARRFMRQPMTVHAGHDVTTGPSPHTEQLAYRTHSLNKVEVVARILQAESRGLTMIFTRTKRAADRLAEDLDFRGFAVAAVHGDLGQGARERALRAFRAGKIDILVATDVAARGLDVTGVTHVINYDCPEDADTYVHRIGRTGRAGATGVAVTFVDWEDLPRWQLIDKSLQLDQPEPPETYHTSPWLFTDLDIPADAGATLPTADRTRVGLSAEVLEDVEGKAARGRTRSRGGRTRKAPESDGAPASGDASQRQRRRRKIVEGEPTAAATADEAPAPRPRRRRRRPSGGDAGGE
jgi:superfamily II DNA/RNA helicase